MSDGGKGSKPRPYSVSKEEFDRRWENIFKKPDMSKIADKVVQQVEESAQKKDETGKE